ncbi:MAG: hypothetical protein IIY44_04880 [Erysipelotrichales bacterium]|nr:hypothetical protein [Erysipelotrichales bacterium]MBQ1386935.1 hypothetical protein [Erysipelotrichales bacterium]MBQ2309206.1 hypothetical protein [Erysipelotrichales bacterium]MBQ2478212.1 hypothetical protein [Erysipelotrichales bacterium]MBQ4374245.1 hypothetical protein [Erysipelotrichales bacterium]
MRSILYQCSVLFFGSTISATALLAWLMCIGCLAGIIKVLTSSSGKLTVNGMTFQWKK